MITTESVPAMRQRVSAPSLALPTVALLLPAVRFLLDRHVHLFLDVLLLYYWHWYMLDYMYWYVFHHWHFFHNLNFFNNWNVYGNMDFLYVMVMDRVHFVGHVDGHMFAVNKQKRFQLCYLMKRLREILFTRLIK